MASSRWCFTISPFEGYDTPVFHRDDFDFLAYAIEDAPVRRLRGLVLFPTPTASPARVVSHLTRFNTAVWTRLPATISVDDWLHQLPDCSSHYDFHGTIMYTPEEVQRKRLSHSVFLAKNGRLHEVPGDILLQHYGNLLLIQKDFHTHPSPTMTPNSADNKPS